MIEVVLFQFESRHWSLQILFIGSMFGQVVLLVKILNAVTINPKKPAPPEADSDPPPR